MKAYRFFILSAAIVAADQTTKALVVKNIELYTTAWSLWGDFFRLIHVRNTGVAFSMGAGLPDALRIALFVVVPLLILGLVAVYILRGRDLSDGQRWILAGILGGGIGNQIDRIIHREGVVDFLDFKFYGIFGMERWPTFNIADASLVVSSVALAVCLIASEVKARKR